MIKTNLAQAVDATGDPGAAYDTNVKYLLADKQILSRILKYTVDEFRDMDVQDIMDCIGDDIETGVKPVDAGLSNLGRVKETATEDNIPAEGIICYDIRFTAYHKEKELKILINIEAQKSSDAGKLGYHLENRIIFYLARMISAQKQTEFFHSDFDNLKKVRSIWICMGMSAGTAVLFSGLVFFGGESIYHLFTKDAAVISQGMVVLRLLAPYYITYVTIEIISGAVRGAGDSILPMIITCIGICVLRVAWIALAVPLWRDIRNVCLSYPITWTVTSVAFLLYYFQGGWLRKRIERMEQSDREDEIIAKQ